MPIVYAAVAAKSNVTAEYPDTYPKIGDVCKRIVATVPLNSDRKTMYEQDSYNFCCKSAGESVFVCVATKDLAMRVCFAFLESLQAAIQKGGNQKQIIKERMEFHNNPANDKLSNLQAQIDDVHDIMRANIDNVLARGERIEAITAASEALVDAGRDFERGAKRVKRAFWLRHIKILALIACIVIIVIIAIVLGVCSPSFSRCR